MPLVVDKTPKNLKPFHFLGAELEWKDGDERAWGDCPLCGREQKFSVNVDTSQWDCKKCGASGNAIEFIRQLYDRLQPDRLDQLAAQKKILDPESLRLWGVRWLPSKNNFVIPGYNHKLEISQLYRYIQENKTKKWILLPVPTLGHGIHLPDDFDPSRPTLYVNEGPWDGIAFWETGIQTKDSEGAFKLTANRDMSILKDANVAAIPGCGAVGEPMRRWLPFFNHKNVIWLGDSDHPKEKDGTISPPAGFAAAKRAVDLLAHIEEPPTSFKYLNWGEEGYDPSRPSGYDVRDVLSPGKTIEARIALLPTIFAKIQPIPGDWIKGRSEVAKTNGSLEVEPRPCSDWNVLIKSWEKALKWTPGLDRALSVMLASVASTKAIGSQLWVKIIGPAACGKSTLCEAVSTNKNYVTAKSTIRGFHSGYRSSENSGEDNSLIAKLYDKTLVTKDGDTLLQSPNLGQILSEARDIYDRVSRTHYRNGLGSDYEGLNMTWILCGTSSLRSIDSSELGERFLDCVIMEGIDEALEREILMIVAEKTARNLMSGGESNGESSTQHDPDKIRAMQLTGGYVDYLRENASMLLSEVEASGEALSKCSQYGLFVAYIRARPSKVQTETAERELATRLVEQMIRLAFCLAIVMNKKSLDYEVLQRVRAVALDTARGRTFKICQLLAKEGAKGLHVSALAMYTGMVEDEELAMLRFLKKINVVEGFIDKSRGSRTFWRLTSMMTSLYTQVVASK